jgi:tetratricopeptide (TPR) repeat protein
MSTPGRTARRSAPTSSIALLGLLGIVSLGAILRLVLLSQIRRIPFFDYPIIDGAEYLAWARRILAGEWIWRDVPIHGPLYAYFTAILLGAWSRSLAFVIACQLTLGIASAVLAYRIGRRLFDDATGIVAALIAATYIPFLYFEGLILPASLIVVLNLALLDRLSALPRRLEPRALVIPGLLLGLSAATHPTGLVLLGAVVPWLVLRGRRRDRAGGAAGVGAPHGASAEARATARAAATLTLCAAAVVLAIVARNTSLGGGPVLQRNMGKNLYIGMGPTADGTANVPPGVSWDRLRREAWEAGARTPAEETRYFLGAAIGFATRHPLRAAALVGKKVLLFASGIHVDASQDFRFFRTNAPLLALPLPSLAIVVPLGLFGALRLWRHATLLGAYLAAYLVAIVAFAFSTRYALPAHAALVVFAAAALVELARGARARRLAAGDASLLALLFLTANLDPFHLRSRQLLHTMGHLAKIYFDAGRPADAARLYEAAAKEHPDDPDILNGWGTLLDRLGDRTGARARYDAALAAAPDHFEARFNVAAQAYEEGALARSEEDYRRAIAASPWRADARLNLSVIYAAMDSLDRAAAELDTARALAPRYPEVILNLASIEIRRGAPERAAALCKALLAESPSAETALLLGEALDASGDYVGAQEAYRRALRIDPKDRGALYALGLNLAGFQRYEEAIETWGRLLAVEPGHAAAAAAIAEAQLRLERGPTEEDTANATTSDTAPTAGGP